MSIVEMRSSLENYTSNNTTQHEHNTKQHEYNTTQHKYKGSSNSKNSALLSTFW